MTNRTTPLGALAMVLAGLQWSGTPASPQLTGRTCGPIKCSM